jgi:eukaryotic-like serine/threonine-protein kinase
MLTNGKKLDERYILREEIGSGGFGAVYRAVDTRFSGNNQVAIKQIPLTNEEAAKSFRQEANLLYNLSHPNLPKVTNCFQQDGASFIVMEYISGEDLSESLKKGKRYSVAESLEIADAVLDALEYLHSFTIFHRDIKPHNIKIDETGKIYLLDFGTAKGTFDETTLTQNVGQSITGFTPFYAPLEQVLRVDPNSYLLLQSLETPYLEEFLNRRTDARSDIYSLGATLYHLLTGYSPEKATATTRAFALWSGKSDPLLPCQVVNPEIPEGLAQILHRCLEIEPEKRFQTAAELRKELKNPSALISPPKVSEQMTAVLPPTQNPLIAEFDLAAQSIATQESNLNSEPLVRFSFDVENKPENEAVLPPIEDLFSERKPNRAKPKSKSGENVFAGCRSGVENGAKSELFAFSPKNARRQKISGAVRIERAGNFRDGLSISDASRAVRRRLSIYFRRRLKRASGKSFQPDFPDAAAKRRLVRRFRAASI